MTEFILPPIGEYKKFTKELILLVLAAEHPLTLKQIKTIITKQHGVSVTYQAVRKSVNNLVTNKILCVQNKEYAINTEWILQIETYVRELRKEYFSKKKFSEQAVGDIHVFKFNNMFDLNKMWRDIHFHWLHNAKKTGRSFWWGDHCWWVIGELSKEDLLLQEIESSTARTTWINKGNTFLDKWAKKYYDNYKYCEYTIVKEETNGINIAVFGDIILESKFPEALRKKLHNFYAKTKNVNEIDLGELMKILKEKHNIEMTFMENHSFAEQLRASFLSKIKETKN